MMRLATTVLWAYCGGGVGVIRSPGLAVEGSWNVWMMRLATTILWACCGGGVGVIRSPGLAVEGAGNV